MSETVMPETALQLPEVIPTEQPNFVVDAAQCPPPAPDVHHSPDEITGMVEDNFKLVYHVMSKMYIEDRDKDNALSAGMQGLWEAAQRYDSSIGKFSTFAWPRIWGAINDYYREYYKLNRRTNEVQELSASNDTLRLDSVEPGCDETFQGIIGNNAPMLEDTICDAAEAQEQLEMLPLLLGGLSERNQTIIRDWAAQKPVETIMEEQGISRSRVFQIIAKSIKKMKVAAGQTEAA